MTSQRVRRGLASAGIVGLLLLSGCSLTPEPTSGDVTSLPAGGAPAPGEVRQEDKSAPEEVGDEDVREIARTAQLTIGVKDVSAAAARLRQIAEAADGYISSERIDTSTEKYGESTVVLSVAADQLEQAMNDAEKIGTIRSRSMTAKDVTAQVVDVEARITTLRESIARIRALMEKAGSLSDIANIEAELTRRQSDLESMLARQKALKNQVERAPLTVTLFQEGTEPIPDNPFLRGLQEGWEAMAKSTAILITMVGALVPFAIVGLALFWPLRWAFRRRAAAATSAPKTEPKPETRTETEPKPDDQG
ncbi:MAG: DUF4349 domain-containing protein [Micropruina sp.]